MSGIRITIQQTESGEYQFGLESLHPFEKINPKFLNMALDIIKENRNKIIGNVDEKFYDKEYFEGKSEKSGLVGFDEMSKGYAMEHAKDRVEKLLTLVGGDKTSKILEIGCAFGHTVDALRGLGYEAYGVDISEYAINKYKQDYKYVSDFTIFRIMMSYDGCVPNGYFDFNFIYGFNLMEHIAELDLRKFLKNLHYNLSQNGIAFFTIDPVWGNDLSHTLIKPRDWWDEVFKSEGFEIHKEGTDMFRGINGHVYKKV